MTYYIIYISYFVSILFASFNSIYRFRRLDTAAKILSLLVCCAWINEGVAYYLARKYHNNIPLYTCYSLIEYTILCVYFNRVIDVFAKKNIGIYIAVIGVLLGVANIIFLQDINSFNSYFLLFEGLVVIGMSLFAFFRMLLTEDAIRLYQYAHFRFISILVFFWSITFLTWGLYNYINIKLLHDASKINSALLIFGAITYSSLGLVFFFYPKKAAAP